MYGIGIPTLRPRYAVENYSKLIPNKHYIAVDLDFDENFGYKNPKYSAQLVYERYKEVINDDEFLKYVAINAREWYIDNLTYPSIINNIMHSLKL
jgi:hypothetical protein